MNKIKESKNIFPCILRGIMDGEDDCYISYVSNGDNNGRKETWVCRYHSEEDDGYEEAIVNNVDELKDAIDEFFNNPEIDEYGSVTLRPQGDIVKNIMNKGKGRISVYEDPDCQEAGRGADTIITAIPVQSLELSLTESYDNTPNNYNLILKDDKILTTAFPEDIKRAIRDYGTNDFKDIFGIDESNITTYKTLTGDKYYALKFHDSEDAELFFRTQTGIGLDEFLESTNSKIENKLAESFEKTIKNMQKEGLFENISSFDLDFNGKGINIKLNEMAYKDDYDEYNKKSKEYKNYMYRSWRQYSFVGNRLFKIDPVSFNFKGETFTIKNTYIGDESSRNLKKFTYTIAVVRGSEVLGEVRFDDWADTSRNERDLFQQVFDKADIPYKDKEAFFKIFDENFNKFYESMDYDQSFEDNELFNKYKDNRDKKLDAFYKNNSNLQANAEKSWRQEHFGIGDYEVGQTVEVFDGRSGSARSLGKIIKITPSGTATIQLEDGTTIVRRHIEDDANIELFRPVNYHDELVEPSISTEDVISNRKRNLGIE